jgi:hypothetical protein
MPIGRDVTSARYGSASPRLHGFHSDRPVRQSPRDGSRQISDFGLQGARKWDKRCPEDYGRRGESTGWRKRVKYRTFPNVVTDCKKFFQDCVLNVRPCLWTVLEAKVAFNSLHSGQNPRSTVLAKLMVSHLVKKFPAFYWSGLSLPYSADRVTFSYPERD